MKSIQQMLENIPALSENAEGQLTGGFSSMQLNSDGLGPVYSNPSCKNPQCKNPECSNPYCDNPNCGNPGCLNPSCYNPHCTANPNCGMKEDLLKPGTDNICL